MRPATRIGRWLIFAGGLSRRLPLWEWTLVKLRLRRRVELRNAEHDLTRKRRSEGCE